jgi:hypothetical protein
MGDRQRCLSVTYDEGLRSYKAIAFIRSLIFYLELGATSQPNVLSKQKTFRYISENSGENLWIK